MTEHLPIDNPIKRKLAAGEYVLCMSIRQLRTVDASLIAQASGFDALYVDQEHSQISTEATSQISLSAVGLGVTPLVRVRALAGAEISCALDGGALGVIVPGVENRIEAEAVVREAMLPPQGIRSVSAVGAATRYRNIPLTDLVELQNNATLIAVMIESAKGISNVDEIAAVPGVDLVMVGPNDLSAALGIPGQTQHPLILDAYAKVADACRRHKKYFAGGGAGGPKLAEVVRMGARFLLGGSDVSYLLMGARQGAMTLRAAIEENGN